MLKDTSGVEVVNKGFFVPLWRKMVDDCLDLRDEGASLDPSISAFAESVPQRQDNYLRVGPDFVNSVNELDVAVVVFGVRHVVVS